LSRLGRKIKRGSFISLFIYVQILIIQKSLFVDSSSQLLPGNLRIQDIPSICRKVFETSIKSVIISLSQYYIDNFVFYVTFYAFLCFLCFFLFAFDCLLSYNDKKGKY